MGIKKIIPAPLKKIIKKLINEALYIKWKNHPAVADWISKGWLDGKKETLNFVYSYQKNFKRVNEPVPPPHKLKQEVIAEYSKRFGYRIFIETGTYLGEMIDAQMNNFEKIYTIELDQRLFERASDKYKNTHVKCLQGDSGSVLPQVTKELDEPAIFWLDGHYSGGITAKGGKNCPIYNELEAVLSSEHDHVILIDDARCFGFEEDYPAIEELKGYVRRKKPDYEMLIKNDIIRLCKI